MRLLTFIIKINMGSEPAEALTWQLIEFMRKLQYIKKNKNHCNIVCRDVSKAFDKVWTKGLKYKIIRINGLPSIIKNYYETTYRTEHLESE